VAVSAALALAAAGGCSLPPRAPPAAPSSAGQSSTSPSSTPRGSAPQGEAATVAQADHLVIDPAQSELRLLVFRAGALARLGHDHVIVAHGLSGWIDPDASGPQQLVDLVIPVDAFDVDPDAARAEEGAAFAEPITAEAKAGTRHNMLGEALLDAARYPRIAVRGLAAEAAESTTTTGTGTTTGPTSGTTTDTGTGTATDTTTGTAPRSATLAETRAATLAVAVAGHESRQTVAMNIVRDADRLTLSADFSLRQTALGLTPFSVMMGALQVQDEMHVHVRIVARRAQSGAD
jgi:hypothetical protein